MRRLGIILFVLAIGGRAFAADPECVSPIIPACALDYSTYNDEAKMTACMRESEIFYDKMNDYRTCLWDYRDDAIFLVENKLNHMVAEMAALKMFTACMLLAPEPVGPGRCPELPFGKDR